MQSCKSYFGLLLQLQINLSADDGETLCASAFSEEKVQRQQPRYNVALRDREQQ